MATMDELESRIRILEDERELRQLISHYAFRADFGQSEAWVQLWTEDGAYDLGAGRNRASGGSTAPELAQPGRYAGHDDLLWKLICGRGHKLIEGRSQHHTIGPLSFEIDGDSAVAYGYSLVIVQSDTQTREVISGRTGPAINVASANANRWTFARESGRWKIRERYNRQIGTVEALEIFFGPDSAMSSP